MRNRPLPVKHPQEFRLPRRQPVDSNAKPSASEASSASETRQDPWGSAWFRINLEPFWNRFLNRGIQEGILDAAHFKIFLLLTTLMNSRNQITQSQDELASLVRLKPSRVSEVLKDLEAMGCVQRVGGRRKGALIRIDPELVTRASRLTHLKAIDEWKAEARQRDQESHPTGLLDQNVPF